MQKHHIKYGGAIFFAAALALTGAEPRDAVFADDRAEMVAAARALGIDAFAVESAEGMESDLRARGLLGS